MSMPELARRGLTVAAISAIDIALWDILGKSLGEPVWQLLGGRKADAHAGLCLGRLGADADTIGEQLQCYIDQGGFKAVKMRVGAMDGTPHISAARVKAARASARPRYRPHGRRPRHLHRRRRETLRPPGARLRPGLVRGTGDRRRQARHGRGARRQPASRSPPAKARRRASTSATSRLLRAADIFQPDLGFCGGITRGDEDRRPASRLQHRACRRICGPARLPSSPGCTSAPRRRPASSWNIRSAPTRCCMIWSWRRLDVADGIIAIPDAPGLGITIDEDFLKAHAMGG